MIRRCSPAAFIVQSAFIAHFFLLIEPKLIDKPVRPVERTRPPPLETITPMDHRLFIH
jgi:hypothetical protein